MNIFRYVLDRTDLDVILSYNHYTLQNTMLAGPRAVPQGKGVGIMNAAPFSARLLTNAPLPPWHKATPRSARPAGGPPSTVPPAGVDIAQLALQFSIANEDMATCIVGSANPENVRKWADGPTCRSTRTCSPRCSRSSTRSTTGSTSKAGPRTTTSP